MNNPVGARIKKQRERLGIPQHYMGDELGINQSVYGRLEKDDSRIDIVRLKKIAVILEVTTKYLLWGYEEERINP